MPQLQPAAVPMPGRVVHQAHGGAMQLLMALVAHARAGQVPLSALPVLRHAE